MPRTMIHLIEQAVCAYETSGDLGVHVHTVAQKDVEGSEVLKMERKLIVKSIDYFCINELSHAVRAHDKDSYVSALRNC
jgi:hypothetical protein